MLKRGHRANTRNVEVALNADMNAPHRAKYNNTQTKLRLCLGVGICGERGIRTLEELSPLTVFKTVAINQLDHLSVIFFGPVLYHLFFVIQTMSEMMCRVTIRTEEFQVGHVICATFITFDFMMDL